MANEELEAEIFENFGVRGATESIAAAWEVVEKMRASGMDFTLSDRTQRHGHRREGFYACFNRHWSSVNESASLAICLAALAAVRERKD